jgi:hypothetical protein
LYSSVAQGVVGEHSEDAIAEKAKVVELTRLGVYEVGKKIL